MAQENVTNASLDQGTMMNKFTEIVKWMQQYEISIGTSIENTTQSLTQVGYCYALSNYILNDAIVDYEKRKADPHHTDPSHIDEFYETLKFINSCSIPPKPGQEKEFYHKVNGFTMMLWQLQNGYVPDTNALNMVSKEINISILNTLAPLVTDASGVKQQSGRSILHTYCFDEPKKLLEWAQKAKIGDTLLIYISTHLGGHAVAVYVRANSNGEPCIGFYDPNNAKPIEIKQEELKRVEQIVDFNLFNGYPSKILGKEHLIICRHIVSTQEAAVKKAPIIDDSSLSEVQRQEAILELLKHGAAEESISVFARLYKKEIALAKQEDREATKKLFNIATYAALNNAKANLSEYIQLYSERAKKGDKEAMQAFFTAAIHTPDILKHAQISHEEYINLCIVAATEKKDVDIASILVNTALTNSVLLPAVLDINKYAQQFLELSTQDNALGKNMLSWAVKQNNKELVQALLNKKVGINSQDKAGNTPLHYATMCAHSDMVDLLLSKDAEVNIKNTAGNTPICCSPPPAISAKLLDAHAYLLPPLMIELAARCREYPQMGPHILDQAILHDDEMVIQALHANGMDINALWVGALPISWAIIGGQNKAAVALLELGAKLPESKKDIGDIVQQSRSHSAFAQAMLCAAVKQGREDIVDQLLSIPYIHITAKDKHGTSALDYAKAANHENMIAKLEPRVLGNLITLSRTGHIHATQELFYMALLNPHILIKAGENPKAHICNYSILANSGNLEAKQDLFHAAIKNSDILREAGEDPREHIHNYSWLAQCNNPQAMQDLFHIATENPLILQYAGIKPIEHIQHYSQLAQGGNLEAKRALFNIATENPRLLQQAEVQPIECVQNYSVVAKSGNPQAMQALFHVSTENPNILIEAGEDPKKHIHNYSILATDGSAEAKKDLFNIATKDPAILIEAGVQPIEHIQNYSLVAKAGNVEAAKALFHIATEKPTILIEAGVRPIEHIQNYSLVAQSGNPQAMQALFHIATENPDILIKAGIPPINHIRLYSYLAKSGNPQAIKDLFNIATKDPDMLTSAQLSPEEYINLCIEAALTKKDVEAAAILVNAVLAPTRLIEGGIDINRYAQHFFELSTHDNALGAEMLCWAVDQNHIKLVEALLDKEVDINSQDKSGNTPLHYATGRANHEMLDLLLDKHAHVNIKNDCGNTPLCYSHAPAIFAKLICASAIIPPHLITYAIRMCAPYPETAPYIMKQAVRLDEVDAIKTLHANGTDINAISERLAPIQWAILCKKEKSAIVLLEAGARLPESQNDIVKIVQQSQSHHDLARATLCAAASQGKEDLVDQLLQIPGLDITTHDKHDQSALDYAKKANHTNIVKKLTPLVLWKLAEKAHIPTHLTSRSVSTTSTHIPSAQASSRSRDD